MADKVLDNNQVNIVGVVDSEFTYSHEVFGEGFYMIEVMVNRLSSMVDRIPLLISERIVDVTQSYIGQTIRVQGQFRSYNKHEEGRNRLVLSVFVREFSIVDNPEECDKPNSVYLDGYICKVPVYRMTPLGREIADLLLASESSLRKIRLFTMYLLGEKRPVRRKISGWRSYSAVGKNSKPVLPEKGGRGERGTAHSV